MNPAVAGSWWANRGFISISRRISLQIAPDFEISEASCTRVREALERSKDGAISSEIRLPK
jgi:hypothetical protein